MRHTHTLRHNFRIAALYDTVLQDRISHSGHKSGCFRQAAHI